MPKSNIRVPDESADYGLRTRGKHGMTLATTKTSRIASKVRTRDEPYFKSWSVPLMPDVNMASMKALGKTAVKADLRAIRKTLEPDLREDAVRGLPTEEDYALQRVRASSSRGDEEDSRRYSSGGDSRDDASNYENDRIYGDPGTGYSSSTYMESSNFYFPYKKMKAWGELKDYLDFVSEQTYNSMRQAYVERMDALRLKKERQMESLKILEKECTRSTKVVQDTRVACSETTSILQKLLKSLEYYKNQASDLAKENEMLRSKLADLQTNGSRKQKSTTPTLTRPPKRRRSSSRSPSSRSTSKAKQRKLQDNHQAPKDVTENIQSDTENEWYTISELISELRCVHTTFGVGVVHGVRLETSQVMIKLDWGAVAFLNFDALNSSSIDTIINSSGPLCDMLAKTFGEEAEFAEEDDLPSNDKDLPILFTRSNTGPPRGVPLEINAMSTEPHFAVPTSLRVDPNYLRRIYDANGLVVPVASEHQEIDAQISKEDSNADLDIRFKKRDDLLAKMPFTWDDGAETSMWGKNGVRPSRLELKAWQDEHIAFEKAKAQLQTQEKQIQNLTNANAESNKRMIEMQSLQEDLLQNLITAKAEAAGWRHKVARILHGTDVEEEEPSQTTKLSSRPRGQSIVSNSVAESEENEQEGSDVSSTPAEKSNGPPVSRRRSASRLGPRRLPRRNSSPASNRGRRGAT